MKTVKLTSICIAFYVVLMFMTGCNKLDDLHSKKQITFKGYLMSACGVPIQHKAMHVDYFAPGFSNKNKSNIGSDTTDDDGYFQIVCSNEGADYYKLIADNIAVFQYFGEEQNIHFDNDYLIDLGEIFSNYNTPNRGGIIFRSASIHNSDTLYFGQNGKGVGMVTVFPIPNIYFFPISFFTSNEIPYITSVQYAYGVGMASYLKASDSLYIYLSHPSDSTTFYNMINAKMTICGNVDTAFVNIP